MAKSEKKQSQAHDVTSGSAIRFEQPRSSRQHHGLNIQAPEVRPISGFLDFLREHAVVGVAIGFIIGLQAQTVVKQLVSSFIDPLFNLLFGQALSLRTFTLHFNEREAIFSWGAFAYGLLNFLFVLAGIYILVKIFMLDKLDKPKKD